MSESASTDGFVPQVSTKPPGTREFTIRAVIAGVVVAAIMGASYPYVVLKLGFGPNVSVVAAFFGYLFLGILFRNFNRWENNIVQTAGTSASQTAFMCVVLAAFDMMKAQTGFAPGVVESFLWLTAASILGVLLAVPLRSHYVVEEQLTYADGVAAAETIIVLDARGKEARNAALALYLALLASALVWFLTTSFSGQLFDLKQVVEGKVEFESVLPETLAPTMFGATLAAVNTGAGFSVSLLSLGSGMIVGNRVNISMAVGAIIAWVIAPHILFPAGLIESPERPKTLLWMMWPGTGMLIAAGLTSLGLKWRTLTRTFTRLSTKSIDASEFPLRWVGIGVAAATVMLIIVQAAFFSVPFWLTLIATLLSIPLMLVGLRVLGETNWGPISQLTNMMQAIFAGLAPGNLVTNLAASGTTGTIAVQSEAIMQDYKAGHIIGSTPRFLTYSQLIAAPIGAAAVAIAYPLFRDFYEGKLSSPISRRIVGFAEIVAKGFDALPPYALAFMAIGAVIGIGIAVAEHVSPPWVRRFLPSATGLGIGMMVPGDVVFTMVVGGLVMFLWQQIDRKRADVLGMPLASGLIAGEALMAIIMPILVALGVFRS